MRRLIAIGDPILDQLGAYWAEAAGERRYPDWRDIDPVRIPRTCLRYVVVADLVDGAAAVRYRLVGSNMVTHFGQDFAGKTTAEVMSDSYHRFILDLFRRMYLYQAPVYSRSGFRWDAGRHLLTRRLFMPLSSGGADVAMAFIGQTFDPAPASPGEPFVRVLSPDDIAPPSSRAGHQDCRRRL